MGRGHPTSRTPSYVTGLEVLLEAKNDKIAELEARLEDCKWCGASHERGENTLCPLTIAETKLDAMRGLQQYDSRPFGYTGNKIQYFKSDDGGIVLWKDVQAALNGEGK